VDVEVKFFYKGTLAKVKKVLVDEGFHSAWEDNVKFEGKFCKLDRWSGIVLQRGGKPYY